MDKQVTDTNSVPQTAKDDFVIVAGKGMNIDTEPVDKGELKTPVATSASTKEEDTSTNEVLASDTPKEKAEGETNRASEIISSLGEDRKKLAENLLKLASESKEAEAQVKTLIEEDSSIAKLIKTKFGKSYDELMKPKKEREHFDVDSIREEERIKARADIILEQISQNKTRELETFAQSKGFNSDEFQALKKYVDVLEKTDGFEKALEKSAILVNSSKANTKRSSYSPVASVNDKEGAKTKPSDVSSDAILRHSRATNRKPEQIAKNLQEVEELIGEDGAFYLPFN